MQLLTFILNNIRFGIPVSYVESIENRMSVIGIPNAPEYIQGIVNLHGDIVPVYSLADRFAYTDEKIQNMVVVSVNGMKIGLEVASISEILEVDGAHIIPMPTIMNATQTCFNDVASHDKELIVMVDVSQLIPEAEQQGIKKMIDDNAASTNK